MGLGLGLIIAPAMSTATLGVDRRDAGVASAMVNTGQQIGGSIGTALLSTLAASAATSYASTDTARPPTLAAQAAVHGYTTAFTWSAGDLRGRRRWSRGCCCRPRRPMSRSTLPASSRCSHTDGPSWSGRAAARPLLRNDPPMKRPPVCKI